VGLQLAAASDGTWMIAFRDDCGGTDSCDVFGRRFSSDGLPVFSDLAAGDIAFKLDTNLTTGYTTPAAAASGTSTAAFWDYEDPSTFERGIACRVLDSQGAAAAGQVAVLTAPTDVVAAIGITAGNYAVVWEDDTTFPYSIYGAIVTPSCTPAAGSPFVVSPSGPANAGGAGRAHVAANGTTLLFAWITDNEVWIRIGNTAGPSGPEMRIITKTTQTIEHVRVAPWGDGFAVAVRWASDTEDGPGKIEVYRVDTAGARSATATLVTDQSRSDFNSSAAFGIAQRASDNALLVVWHVCETGPGLCDVFGRMLRPSGAPVGEPFIIPTSVLSEQINPSVVSIGDAFVAAWTDSSAEAPDRSGSAVRARVITPLYDDARGVHGATCGASAPGSPDCNEGLACAMGTDAVQRCYYECGAGDQCPAGGTCDTTTSACTF
jgi:hypothetical protein